MRRLTQSLLLALVVVSIQTAGIAHQHAGDALPAGQQSAVCDFCTGIHAGAPPLEPTAAAHPAPASIVLPTAVAQLIIAKRPSGAHGSRAPPALHSI